MTLWCDAGDASYTARHMHGLPAAPSPVLQVWKCLLLGISSMRVADWVHWWNHSPDTR